MGQQSLKIEPHKSILLLVARRARKEGVERVNTTGSKIYCKGKTKKGKPCRAAAMEGGLCFFHANPNKAAELGRVGGRRNRHYLPGEVDPPVELRTAKAVKEECARLIEKVYTRKISPRVAACVGALLNLQMRVIREADLEVRIAKLEQAQAGNNQPATEELDRTRDAANQEAMGDEEGSR